MKIVSWNCHYGLSQKKYDAIIELTPDILIIHECKKPDFELIKSKWKNKNFYNDDLYTDKSEYGSELGVAIFSDSFNIKFTDIFNRKYRYFIPYEISNNEIIINLFAVWIKPDDGNYLTPLYNAVDYYKEQNMINDNTIIIGDFNTFAKENNERLVALEKKLSPLVNCANNFNNSSFYNEPTFNSARYGLGIDDFCFISKNFNCRNIKFITHKDWKNENEINRWNGSDHCPISVEFDIN